MAYLQNIRVGRNGTNNPWDLSIPHRAPPLLSNIRAGAATPPTCPSHPAHLPITYTACFGRRAESGSRLRSGRNLVVGWGRRIPNRRPIVPQNAVDSSDAVFRFDIDPNGYGRLRGTDLNDSRVGFELLLGHVARSVSRTDFGQCRRPPPGRRLGSGSVGVTFPQSAIAWEDCVSLMRGRDRFLLSSFGCLWPQKVRRKIHQS